MISMSFPLTDEKHREPTGRVSSQEYVESQRQQGVGGVRGDLENVESPLAQKARREPGWQTGRANNYGIVRSLR